MLPFRKFRAPVLFERAKKIFCRKMSQVPVPNYFAWIDLEMTGLDVDVHHIIEIACIVTKPDLSKIGNGIHFVVHQPEEVHDNSNEWSLIHHKKSLLRDESINSKVSIQEADSKVFEYIKSCKDPQAPAQVHLAGNSVYMDKLFIAKYMPLVDSLLHYQILDVTSIKLLYQNWSSGKIFLKSGGHRALHDVNKSIEELKFYRENFFIKQ